jgi:hypothetical protein
VNAASEVWNRTATPSATASVCPSSPVIRPSVVSTPARIPYNEDCVSTMMTSGPGVIAISSDATKNAHVVSKESIRPPQALLYRKARGVSIKGRSTAEPRFKHKARAHLSLPPFPERPQKIVRQTAGGAFPRPSAQSKTFPHAALQNRPTRHIRGAVNHPSNEPEALLFIKKSRSNTSGGTGFPNKNPCIKSSPIGRTRSNSSSRSTPSRQTLMFTS